MTVNSFGGILQLRLAPLGEGADCEVSETIVRGGAVAVFFGEADGLDAGGTEHGVAAQQPATDSCGNLGR